MPDFASLEGRIPLEWFKDAKFSIYFHWGFLGPSQQRGGIAT
jgi:hypothetical protein